MSDNAFGIALTAIIVLSLTTCAATGDWKDVQRERIRLEREKLGMKP
jgi:hypothetical protein